MVKFKISKADSKLVSAIVTRALDVSSKFGGPTPSREELTMDLVATHSNGCRMDFARLAGADDFNVAHDVFGIHRHIDRNTGKLTSCFIPRFKSRK